MTSTSTSRRRELAELGAGVQISANGARVLFALGLEDAIRNVWCEPAGKEIRLWNTGETWKLFDLGAESVARYGAPYFMIHRADLHRRADRGGARAEAAMRSISARAATGFDDDGTGVTLHLADGERVSGDALIGADGVHSRIRNILVGDDKPDFTGCMAWRGLVPVEKLAAAHAAQCRRQLGRSGRPRHQLSAAARRDLQFRRHRRARLARGILDRAAAAARNAPRTFPAGTTTSTRSSATSTQPYKWALLGREPLTRFSHGRVDAARRCRASDAADAGAGRQHGDRGRHGAGALPRARTTMSETALARYDAARVERTAKLVRGANDMAKRFHNPALADADGAQAYVDARVERGDA